MIIHVKCRNCYNGTEILKYKSGGYVLTSIKIAKVNGWIINFSRLNKSLCPDCNMFK